MQRDFRFCSNLFDPCQDFVAITAVISINEKNLKAIKDLVKSGCVVVMASQCIFGRVQMHVYAAAVDLVNAGVIPGEDMLAETAFVKLAWLLGNYKKKEVENLIGKNLRGEITPCTRIDSVAEE